MRGKRGEKGVQVMEGRKRLRWKEHKEEKRVKMKRRVEDSGRRGRKREV